MAEFLIIRLSDDLIMQNSLLSRNPTTVLKIHPHPVKFMPMQESQLKGLIPLNNKMI
jgi:hypothetical protein